MPPTVPFLRIAGITIPVAIENAVEQRVARGKVVRAFDNTARSTVDPHTKWVGSITTGRVAPAWLAALLAVAPHGSRQTVDGRMPGGGATNGSKTCVISYGEAPYRKRYPWDADRVVTITMDEV